MTMLSLTGLAAAEPEFVPEAAGHYRQALLDNRKAVEKVRAEAVGKLTPEARAALLARKTAIIEKYAPHWVAEFAAYDRLLGWPEGDFLLARGDVYETQECTSWIVGPDLAASGRMMLQKCRDNRRFRLGVSIQRSPGKLRWLRISNADSQAAVYVMNEAGFALVMNNGDRCRDVGGGLAFGSPGTLRLAAETCRTVEEGIALLTKLAEAGEITGGQIYQMIDPQHAAVLECGGGKVAVRRFDRGFVCWTNSWKLPGMEAVSRMSPFRRDLNRFREEVAQAALARAAEDGSLSWEELLAVSRTCERDRRGVWRGPYCRTSLGSALLVPDPEFPAFLSTAYIALGPQQHTIYLPVALGVTALPRPLIGGAWGDLAFNGFRRNYLSPHVAEFAAMEREIVPAHLAALEEARGLLRRGDEAGATALLDRRFQEQARAVWAKLNAVEAADAAERRK